MKEPTVTIVVPAFQRIHYLREALASALRQTYTDFELIVSDDSASEKVRAYVEGLGDSRIRYRRNEKNLGIAMNNLAAFSEARGRFIASLHDDDAWEPGFLETLVPILEADAEITVAFCDHHLMDEEGRLLRRRTERNSRFFRRAYLRAGRHQPFIRPALIDMAIPMVMAAVFRKSILQDAEYPRRVGGGYDSWLSYLAVKDGNACYYVPQRLTRYRVHEKSGSVLRGARNFRDTIYIRRKFLAIPALAAYRGEIRNGLGVYYGKMALYFLERGSFRKGKIFLRQAFRLLNRPKNILALAMNTMVVLCKKKQP